MRLRRSIHALAAGSILGMLPAFALGDDGPPAGMVQSLASEEYKDRVKAQNDLVAWAQSRPDRGENQLLHALDAAAEPEVRMRLREALLEIVIAEHQKDGKGYVGIRMNETQVLMPGTTEVRGGVEVREVNDGTPASRAGLKRGDVIVAFNDLKWPLNEAVQGFAGEVQRLKPGSKVQLEVLRAAELLKVEVTLAPRPMGMPEVGGLLWPEAADPMADLKTMEKRAKDQFFERWLAQKRAARKPR